MISTFFVLSKIDSVCLALVVTATWDLLSNSNVLVMSHDPARKQHIILLGEADLDINKTSQIKMTGAIK